MLFGGFDGSTIPLYIIFFIINLIIQLVIGQLNPTPTTM